MLTTAVSGEEDLGPEVNTKIQSLTLAPGGDHLSPSQRTDVARLQAEFADVFSLLPGRTNLIQQMEPGVIVCSRPYRLPEHKKSGSVWIRSDARDGSSRRITQWLGEPDSFVT